MTSPPRPQLSLFTVNTTVASARKPAEESIPHFKPALLQGDAYDLAPSLRKHSVDLVLTSPPYWGLRTYDESHNWEILREWLSSRRDEAEMPSYDWYRKNGGLLGLEPLPEWYVQHLVEIFARIRPAVKPSGSMWVNLGDTYFARWSSIRDRGRQGLGDNSRHRRKVPMGGYRQEKQLLMVPARFAIAMQSERWILRNDLIWFKPNVPPRPEKDRLRLAHEHFFHFVIRPTQGRARYFYDINEAEAGAVDVVTCTVRAGEDEHAATFPAKLIAPRISSSCPAGGLMLDPFAGTGRALVVATQLGRQAVGFEISQSFARNAQKRFDSE